MAEPVPQCPVCHTPATTWAVCLGCTTRVDQQLSEILDMHAQAANHELRLIGANPDGVGPIGGSRERSIGQRIDALDLSLGESVLSALETWERDWRHTFGLQPYGTASGRRLEASQSHATAREVTLVGVIGFLRSWWPRAASEHPAADEFVAEVRQQHRWARRALDVGEPRVWTVPCPSERDSRACGYRLEIDYAGRELVLHCPRCGSDWTITRLLLVAEAAAKPVWVDVETATSLIGVSDRTLRRMAERGEIQRRYGQYNVVRHAGVAM